MTASSNVRICPQQAYIDPGTGSMIFQIVIAGALGGLFALKTFWARIRDFLSKSGKGGPRADDR